MKLTHLHLNTHMLNAQRIFYEDVLGLAVIAEDDCCFTVRVGASQLTFTASQTLTASEIECRYHFAFNIPENQIEDARLGLAERVPLLALDGQTLFTSSERWNAHQFYFTDPAGNILECIARHRLPNASSEPFSPAGLLSISEIGIAAADVEAAVAQLEQAGWPMFSGEGSNTFTAVGDDDGLFIVVKMGRTWYPETGVPALDIPLRVEFDDGRILECGSMGDGRMRIVEPPVIP